MVARRRNRFDLYLNTLAYYGKVLVLGLVGSLMFALGLFLGLLCTELRAPAGTTELLEYAEIMCYMAMLGVYAAMPFMAIMQLKERRRMRRRAIKAGMKAQVKVITPGRPELASAGFFSRLSDEPIEVEPLKEGLSAKGT